MSDPTAAVEDADRWRTRFLLSVLGFGFAIAVPSVLVVSQYFGKPVSAILSASVLDGWCVPSAEGLGSHCFGDFQFPRVLLDQGDVWPNRQGIPHPYTPTAMWPHVFFNWLQRAGLGVQGSLFVYLIALGLCLLAPAIWLAWRNTRTYPSGVFIALFGGLTLPFFIVLDRGNSSGFAVPALLAFFVGLRSRHWLISPSALVLVTLIRPQFAIIGIALLVVGRWRDFLMAAMAIASSQVAAFIIWSGDPAQDFRGWLDAIGGFESGQSLLSESPVNLSAARTLVIAASALGRSHDDPVGSAALWIDGNASVITALVLFFTIVASVVAWRRGRTPLVVLAVTLMTATFLAPSISYSYYLAVSLVVVALLVSSSVLSTRDVEPTLFPVAHRRLWFFLVVMALVVSLIPVPISRADGLQSIGLEIAGPAWFAVWAFSIFLLIVDGSRSAAEVQVSGSESGGVLEVSDFPPETGSHRSV